MTDPNSIPKAELVRHLNSRKDLVGRVGAEGARAVIAELLEREEDQDLLSKTELVDHLEKRLEDVKRIGAEGAPAVVAEILELQVWILDNAKNRALHAMAARGKGPDRKTPSICELVAEFVATKVGEERSKRHVEDLQYRLGLFAEHFSGQPLALVKARDLREWLATLKGCLRTKNNFANAVSALLRFAKREHLLPFGWDEMHGLRMRQAGPGEVHVFTPEELVRLFDAALKHPRSGVRALVPWLALRAFAGIREREMRSDRLQWRNVDFESAWVVMERSITKTATWRKIPLHDNLRAWLEPYRRDDGPIYPRSHPLDAWQRLLPTAGVQNMNNALRDSYTTYRLAMTNDIARVSLETGNSPRKITQSYSTTRTHDGRLVTPELAAQWFSIRPPEGLLEEWPAPIGDNKSSVAA